MAPSTQEQGGTEIFAISIEISDLSLFNRVRWLAKWCTFMMIFKKVKLGILSLLCVHESIDRNPSWLEPQVSEIWIEPHPKTQNEK